MPKPEIQRYYETACTKDGKRFFLRFRADRFREAVDHGQHCCRVAGYEYEATRFLDYYPPSRMGEFIPGFRL